MKLDLCLERRFCQSCGMPMTLDSCEHWGTNEDGSGNSDYCFYCLKDGKYIVDYSLSQMVEVWVKYTDKYNGYANTGYSPEQLRSVLSKRLPTLERWKNKQTGREIHYHTIHRIQAFISRHLFETFDIKELSQRAGMSFFHFRRVFKKVTGENVGSYIQRLRMEYFAFRLISSDLPLKQIISDSNYQSKYSFTKAFTLHFGLSPASFRRN